MALAHQITGEELIRAEHTWIHSDVCEEPIVEPGAKAESLILAVMLAHAPSAVEQEVIRTAYKFGIRVGLQIAADRAAARMVRQ